MGVGARPGTGECFCPICSNVLISAPSINSCAALWQRLRGAGVSSVGKGGARVGNFLCRGPGAFGPKVSCRPVPAR